jgi:hypothetical protein
LSDREKNNVIIETYGVKEDVVTKIEKNMLRLFDHVKRMDERRLTEEIYEADLDGNAVNPLVVFHVMHGRKGEVLFFLFFCSVFCTKNSI